MTAVLPITPKDPAAVTIATAVAAAKAAEEVAGVYPRLKWVNDIFWGGKKAGGILCEAKDGFIIVGIGINCEASEKAFPHELRGIAGGLPLNGAARERIISEIYNNLRYYLDADFSKTIEEYRARSTMGGKTVRFLRNGEFITAFVKGIGDDGALIVETGDGETERLTSGEVVIVEKPLRLKIKNLLPRDAQAGFSALLISAPKPPANWAFFLNFAPKRLPISTPQKHMAKVTRPIIVIEIHIESPPRKAKVMPTARASMLVATAIKSSSFMFRSPLSAFLSSFLSKTS